MGMTPQETVEAVARLRERWTPVRSPFHLAPCSGCGGPTFQQPCPLCGYYPRGPDRGRWHPARASLEYFAGAVDRSGVHRTGGNVATWHARSLQRALRPGRSRVTTPAEAAVEGLLAQAQSLGGLATAAEIYDTVAREGRPIHRTHDAAFGAHWEALDLCMALVDRVVVDARVDATRLSPDRAARDALIGRMQAVVAAIHACEPDAARTAMEACRSEVADLFASHRVGGAPAPTLEGLDAALKSHDAEHPPGPAP